MKFVVACMENDERMCVYLNANQICSIYEDINDTTSKLTTYVLMNNGQRYIVKQSAWELVSDIMRK